MSTMRIICAGFGGQGIMTLGKIIAMLGLADGKKVSWMPSYGAEVRGGTAHSMVTISTEDIPSPVIDKADVCIIMNKPSLDKFQPRVKKGGTAILNSSLVDSPVTRDDIKVVNIPATEIASSLGNIKVANMVALGGFIKAVKIISKDRAISLLKDFFSDKKALLELNTRALEEGLKAAS